MITPKALLNATHARAVFGRRIQILSGHIARMLGDEPGTVLDVGCGDGTLAVAVSNLKPKLSFSGIDVFLRPNVAIPAVVYDGLTIPMPEKSVDWVTIVDVLHHTDDPRAVLAECVRVARRGVVIKDHSLEGPFAYTTLRFMDWVGNRGHDVRLPYNYLGSSEWTDLFQSLGLMLTDYRGTLGIYPQPFSLVFDRALHFVARVEPKDVK